MKKRVFLFFVIVVLMAGIIPAQTLPDEFPRAQSMFSQAQRLMREQNYPGAIDVYNELVKGYKNSKYRDTYHYGLARAYYHLGDYKMTIEMLVNFHTLFPNSYLSAYAHHLRANSQYRTGRLEDSFREYILAYRKSSDSRLHNYCERSLVAAVEAGYFPPDSVVSMIPGDIECSIKSRMAYLAKRRWSREKIDSLLGNCPNGVFDDNNNQKRNKEGLVAGLIMPLSGSYAKYGQSVLDGAMLAAETFSHQGVHIELITYDTRADNVTSARQAIALAEAEVDVIIGPLLSSVAATTAASLNNSRIPLLVPAATQAGFTELSSNCFQMSANIITIGRGLAQYAVRHLGMTTLAVISPTSLDELVMAKAFAVEAENLGATILAFEKFRPGETDFGPYIKDLKKAILGPMDDSTFFITLEGDTLRSGEMAVEFDGLFIPANEQQLFLILPQLDFYRVNAAYFGTDEWNTSKVSKITKRAIGNAVFYSNSAAYKNSPGFDNFATIFDARYGNQPDRLAAIGYDAIALLAEAYRQRRRDPGDITEFFKSLNRYDAVSGRITFGATRSNLELPLFRYEDGQVKPLIERPVVIESDDQNPPDSIGTEYIKYEW